ncbi:MULTISPECIES: hypothetical protein [unclassified Streptomyces]|uniref:hypothetical protein n=1 Tax=unclassified Streptomyces TaxID=2593676 RepID=UPI00168A7C4F|nr:MULTISPECIES: hypothetical protein [unclassified Streptomyces]MBD3003195.1 hypothetical protein [Streptomyces sp. 5-10]
MGPEMAMDLARTAGAALVGAMATDTWNQTRDGFVALWRRVHPERAETVGAELEAGRADLLAARENGDELSEAELRAEWQGRVRRLLVDRPDIAATLRELLDELNPAPSGRSADVGEVRMTARSTGKGRVYQAGRDQHITER